ncbi:hypothetical protein CDAR_251991 [Caerostris darwini]|uniref:Uncharacterized protein n=1 Tax=Caerostris darwini TaxID=1538125 RepID=A0AAV4VDR3_9ARAC|nr:hypothetical protein CDAR_251991 [Caerostris darwini]
MEAVMGPDIRMCPGCVENPKFKRWTCHQRHIQINRNVSTHFCRENIAWCFVCRLTPLFGIMSSIECEKITDLHRGAWSDAPTHTTTQPVAIKDLKTLPPDEDNWAERIIPAPRKDLSKMLEEEEKDTTCPVIEEMTQMLGVPILPDTIQSAEMSRNTEDFLLLKD